MYKCQAENVHGRAEAELTVDVLFRPSCSVSQASISSVTNGINVIAFADINVIIAIADISMLRHQSGFKELQGKEMILTCIAVANPEVVKTVSCCYKVNVVARYVFNTLNVCKI